MISPLGHVRLRNGESALAYIARAPEHAWADRIEKLLRHKGDPWNWQNSKLLRTFTSVETRFFVLEKDGVLFANILLCERDGVGLLGHVWTDPAHRGTGASSILMELLLDDFAARAGRVIFLGTEPDSPPWHYYLRRNFVPVPNTHGAMVRYFVDSSEFEESWFGTSGSFEVRPFDWVHWVTINPLTLRPDGGWMRLAAQSLFGPALGEAAFLPYLQTRTDFHAAQKLRLRHHSTKLGSRAWLRLLHSVT